MVEDQFDFHSYCVRKGTLRAYVSMLRCEDNLYGHAAYGKAAAGAVQVGCRPLLHPHSHAALMLHVQLCNYKELFLPIMC